MLATSTPQSWKRVLERMVRVAQVTEHVEPIWSSEIDHLSQAFGTQALSSFVTIATSHPSFPSTQYGMAQALVSTRAGIFVLTADATLFVSELIPYRSVYKCDFSVRFIDNQRKTYTLEISAPERYIRCVTEIDPSLRRTEFELNRFKNSLDRRFREIGKGDSQSVG